jgi:hypothetical protein
LFFACSLQVLEKRLEPWFRQVCGGFGEFFGLVEQD